MGGEYQHRCDICGYSVATSGPWEFYRDETGKRKWSGHPSPCSAEAMERGVYGMSGELLCPLCGVVSDIILVEFKKPHADNASAWKAYSNKDEQIISEDMVMCPDCGNTDLILEPIENKEVRCPQCNKGKLIGTRGIMS